jgi:hypothetical protein
VFRISYIYFEMPEDILFMLSVDKLELDILGGINYNSGIGSFLGMMLQKHRVQWVGSVPSTVHRTEIF